MQGSYEKTASGLLPRDQINWMWHFAKRIFSSHFVAVQYVVYICRYIKEWRKNPKWSFSCCLAMVLPLTELHSEIRGLTGRNMLRQQLQTGKFGMPSMSSSLKESGLVTFDLTEEEETNLRLRPGKRDKMADDLIEGSKENVICRESSACDDHELPRNVGDTRL